MTDKHSEIWEQIEKQRAKYKDIIANADETIRIANALKKEAREGLDALPVHKVRRTRVKSVTTVLTPEDDRTCFDVARGFRLPGALEMFPDGIERTEQGDDD